MEQYDKFYQLHHQQRPLIIANAWNAKSAQIIEQAGFDAIATSSGAIANSLGYEDGEKIPFDELLYIIKRIKACTNIPLSVDVERGYTNDLQQLNGYIQQLIDIGIAGINIEDAQGEEIYLPKLYSIKNYLNKTNQKLFINARTDGFLQKLASPLETTIRRAAIYKDAGADGLFVTAVRDITVINEITAGVTLPVNVVAAPPLTSFDALADSGVKRISMAVLLYKKTYSQLEGLVKAVKEDQSLSPLV